MQWKRVIIEKLISLLWSWNMYVVDDSQLVALKCMWRWKMCFHTHCELRFS